MSISLGLELHNHEFLKLPEPQPGTRGELMLAFGKSIHSCTHLGALNIPARQKLLSDWFYEGDLGFIFAPRGIGKTWLGMGLSTALSAGTTCGPWQAHGRHPVLYVDGEMPCESIEKRIRGMGGVESLKVLSHEVLFHLSNKVLNLGDVVTQGVITDLLVAMKIKVLVLDNLSCLFSGVAENDADSWECVLQWLLTLRRHRIAVVLIHHSGRNTKTMRGTSRREDAAFWVIRLDEIDDEHRKGARFISRFTKDRNSVSEQGAIEWGFVTHGNGMVEITTQPASSLDVFRQWIEDGLTGADEIAQEMGITKGAVSKLAKKGIEAGWLTKHGREYVLI
jgi:AAA domain-containing protein